jgi:2-polyprenyl-3-methyl-5-hydroxy-6-metoxy-1,4-benzoquinol methylase
MPPSPRDHYSYSMYADADMARTFDERRFGGPIGELVASAQASVLLSFVAPLEDRTILDVGTGTGRAALLLARNGAKVTGVDASEEMLEVARKRGAGEGLDVTFRRGDAHALEFEDRAFDAAVSLRVIMHTPDWRDCIRELCRVSKRLVVVDYPSAFSVALAQAVSRRAMRRLGRQTESYRVFRPHVIVRELARSGFRVQAVHRQFVLPISLHKLIGSRRFTEGSEKLLQQLGLLRMFGSPITLVAVRCESS